MPYTVDMGLTHVWTDGAACGTPGPGGWAVLLNGEIVSGQFPSTTNNAMELYAMYQAVDLCPNDQLLVIHTDSKLAIGLVNHGWHTDKAPLRGLVAMINDVARLKGIYLKFEKVKGHANDAGNIRVDKAARMQSQLMRATLART